MLSAGLLVIFLRRSSVNGEWTKCSGVHRKVIGCLRFWSIGISYNISHYVIQCQVESFKYETTVICSVRPQFRSFNKSSRLLHDAGAFISAPSLGSWQMFLTAFQSHPWYSEDLLFLGIFFKSVQSSGILLIQTCLILVTSHLWWFLRFLFLRECDSRSSFFFILHLFLAKWRTRSFNNSTQNFPFKCETFSLSFFSLTKSVV